MNYIRTICYDIIKWDFVVKFDYKISDFHQNRYCAYFYTKNGEKYDFFNSIDHFDLEPNGINYNFCLICVTKYTEIIILEISKYFKNVGQIYDVSDNEDAVWDIFIEWAKKNENLLEKR